MHLGRAVRECRCRIDMGCHVGRRDYAECSVQARDRLNKSRDFRSRQDNNAPIVDILEMPSGLRSVQ
jgi:hypothetical protein